MQGIQKMSSPKARLHLLYLHCKTQPRYETEPVVPQESTESAPVVSVALLIKPASPQQNGFRCTLHLPDHSPVVSDIFPRKKDAEQDAAEKALKQMGKPFSKQDSTQRDLSPEEKMTALVERVGTIFSDKGVKNCQPLKEHFRAAMRNRGDRYGLVPITALAALDSKILSLCKSLHKFSDANPTFTIALVWEAAQRCSSVTCEKGSFWIKRVDPFPTDFELDFLSSEVQGESSPQFQAVYIPHSREEMVAPIQMKVEPHGYYMDVMATKLGAKDGAHIMISRPIPRAPRETRLYWPVPDTLPAISIPQADCLPEFADESDVIPEQGGCNLDSAGKTGLPINKRASNLLGFSVYGDAILASIGSSWKSEGNLASTDLTLSCYYRLLIGRTPNGNYKLSRKAILVAKLPSSFSSRSQWKGELPRSLLIDFCHQHRLPNPIFSFSCPDIAIGTTSVSEQTAGTRHSSYKYKVKVVYNGEAVECEPERLYRSRNDAFQSAALRALLFLSKSSDDIKDEHPLSCRGQEAAANGCKKEVESLSVLEDFAVASPFENKMQTIEDFNEQSSEGVDGGSDSSKTITSGSIVSIAYDVWLVGNGINEKLEAQEDFEFELGIGGVIGELDNCVSGMRVGGSEQFFTSLPCLDLLLAAHGDLIDKFSKFTMGACSLRYNVKVLGSLEPPEDRMESALFSPPLSKQRNEFAIHRIQEAHAKSLVDLGCGSGSLLDAIFDHSTELEHIAGVDISIKSLIRAAKSLHAKLTEQQVGSAARSLKRAVLYDGSLAEADSRLCGFDVATCIEVVEHMDPEPLSKAGEIILGTLSPSMLILSTPNIEYNVILQRMTTDAKLNPNHCKNDAVDTTTKLSNSNLVDDANGEVRVIKTRANGAALDALHDIDALAPMDDLQHIVLFDDENGSQPIKLRNDDHRFEWTREEFQEWANNLASRFGYNVEFAGVGGSEEDPGFASQIAVFTRSPSPCNKSLKASFEIEHPGSSSSIGLFTVEPQISDVCNVQGEGKTGSFSQYREVWRYEREGLSTNSA